MSFQVTDAHIDELHTLGYTVFRGILPPSLIDDLRRECDRGREQAYAKHGRQAQRFQPVAGYDLDARPFADFRELPELNAAIREVLSPGHFYGDPGYMGVLIEPAELPWCTAWHRDWRDNAPFINVSRWEAKLHDLDLLNQSNCALYEDNSLWVVPGSHLRRDLPRERALFPTRPVRGPELEGLGPAARERACLEYCRRMPGAVQLHLAAGDYALYRSTLWHLGNYVPYTKRATLHDFVEGPGYRDWRKSMQDEAERRKEAGHAAWEWAEAA